MRVLQVKTCVLLELVLASALAGRARADGALPGSLGIMLPVDRPQEIVLATNFGLILSEDGGATWLWTCEQSATSMANVYALGPPATAMGGLGDRIYALSPIKGLAFSDDGTCSWQPPVGALAGQSVTDFFADPTNPKRVLAAATATGDAGQPGPASLFASGDGGTSFGSMPVFRAPAGATIVGVEIARSDPSIIYLAYYLTLAGGRDPMLVRSSDGGASWGAPIDARAALGPSIVRIFAVDPADSNRVYLRVSPSAGGGESVAVTPDGGATFQVPLTIANGSVTAFARLASGTVLVGARIPFPNDAGGASGAGYRSTDGGQSFVPWTLTPQPHIVGLAERVSAGRSTLYLSGENYVDGWALATSTDEGATVSPVMTYDRVRGIKPCAQQTCLNTCNYEEMQAVWTPQVCTGALLDAGTVSPPPPSGSGCHCGATGGDRAGGSAILLFAGAVVLKLMRRSGSTRARRGGC